MRFHILGFTNHDMAPINFGHRVMPRGQIPEILEIANRANNAYEKFTRVVNAVKWHSQSQMFLFNCFSSSFLDVCPRPGSLCEGKHNYNFTECIKLAVSKDVGCKLPWDTTTSGEIDFWTDYLHQILVWVLTNISVS